jgi:hypothetical protein
VHTAAENQSDEMRKILYSMSAPKPYFGKEHLSWSGGDIKFINANYFDWADSVKSRVFGMVLVDKLATLSVLHLAQIAANK